MCAAKKPPDRNFLCLDYTDDVLDRHVYSRHSAAAGGETKAATSLVEALALLGQRTGFRDRPTPGAIRREALLQVDRHGYSINERMRHADHRNPNTYGGYYQNAISTVDGQATYFGLEQQLPVLHELFRGFSIRRDYQYRPEVPWRLRKQISDVPPSIEGDNGMVDQRARQKRYDDRRQQRDTVLRTDQQSQAKKANTSADCVYESDFQQARRLMPERDRLADGLFQVGSLRNAQGIELMNDLVTLFSSRRSETYCVELNSSRSHCDTCGIARPGSTSQEWWRHVYHCRKERFERVGGFTDFCFFCFAWIDHVDAWARHATQHSHDVPMKCNMAMFRGTVLRPAWCPDCMSQTGRPGSDGKGLTQFFNVTAWKSHMDQHVHELRPGRHKCSHPRCLHLPSCASIVDYIAHRFDVHLIPVPDGAVDGTAPAKTNHKDHAAETALRGATHLEHSIRTPSPQPHEAYSTDSTRAVNRSHSEASSPRQGFGSSIVAKERGVSSGIGGDRASTTLDMSSNPDYDQAHQSKAGQSAAAPNRLSSSVSLTSVSSCGQLGSTESPTNHRRQSRSGLGGMPPYNVEPGPTTIEILIPPKPPGWQDVPLVSCTGCDDESTGVDTPCDEVSSEYSSGEAKVARAARISPPTSCSPKHLMYSRNPRIATATGTSSRILDSAKISNKVMRRRQAIIEMHARIRDRCRSRIKRAARASA
ncbi:uncharacterized protein HMPREF1541_09036 [Cyphellophora europaea CBS 101466]|uniref:Uncharacterized protein n=1 Tax=Cyphellophora europaea (strain CBS 101466) TaxID=1220924 RepID=W2RM29_CYPE1|nr:uncharacterized protein HMPREF1541_09036 [Cyphellophora europaea CBS 101466]ETN36758.1 hypothetical protein HMPREF1541_09036 [Cyphellophora europaea CBS 101466]